MTRVSHPLHSVLLLLLLPIIVISVIIAYGHWMDGLIEGRVMVTQRL